MSDQVSGLLHDKNELFLESAVYDVQQLEDTLSRSEHLCAFGEWTDPRSRGRVMPGLAVPYIKFEPKEVPKDFNDVMNNIYTSKYGLEGGIPNHLKLGKLVAFMTANAWKGAKVSVPKFMLMDRWQNAQILATMARYGIVEPALVIQTNDGVALVVREPATSQTCAAPGVVPAVVSAIHKIAVAGFAIIPFEFEDGKNVFKSLCKWLHYSQKTDRAFLRIPADTPEEQLFYGVCHPSVAEFLMYITVYTYESKGNRALLLQHVVSAGDEAVNNLTDDQAQKWAVDDSFLPFIRRAGNTAYEDASMDVGGGTRDAMAAAARLRVKEELEEYQQKIRELKGRIKSMEEQLQDNSALRKKVELLEDESKTMGAEDFPYSYYFRRALVHPQLEGEKSAVFREEMAQSIEKLAGKIVDPREKVELLMFAKAYRQEPDPADVYRAQAMLYVGPLEEAQTRYNYLVELIQSFRDEIQRIEDFAQTEELLAASIAYLDTTATEKEDRDELLYDLIQSGKFTQEELVTMDFEELKSNFIGVQQAAIESSRESLGEVKLPRLAASEDDERSVDTVDRINFTIIMWSDVISNLYQDVEAKAFSMKTFWVVKIGAMLRKMMSMVDTSAFLSRIQLRQAHDRAQSVVTMVESRAKTSEECEEHVQYDRYVFETYSWLWTMENKNLETVVKQATEAQALNETEGAAIGALVSFIKALAFDRMVSNDSSGHANRNLDLRHDGIFGRPILRCVNYLMGSVNGTDYDTLQYEEITETVTLDGETVQSKIGNTKAEAYGYIKSQYSLAFNACVDGGKNQLIRDTILDSDINPLKKLLNWMVRNQERLIKEYLLSPELNLQFVVTKVTYSPEPAPPMPDEEPASVEAGLVPFDIGNPEVLALLNEEVKVIRKVVLAEEAQRSPVSMGEENATLRTVEARAKHGMTIMTLYEYGEDTAIGLFPVYQNLFSVEAQQDAVRDVLKVPEYATQDAGAVPKLRFGISPSEMKKTRAEMEERKKQDARVAASRLATKKGFGVLGELLDGIAGLKKAPAAPPKTYSKRNPLVDPAEILAGRSNLRRSSERVIPKAEPQKPSRSEEFRREIKEGKKLRPVVERFGVSLDQGFVYGRNAELNFRKHAGETFISAGDMIFEMLTKLKETQKLVENASRLKPVYNRQRPLTYLDVLYVFFRDTHD